MAASDHKPQPRRRAASAKAKLSVPSQAVASGGGTSAAEELQSGISDAAATSATAADQAVVTSDTPLPPITREYVLAQSVELLRRCLQQVEPVLNRRGQQIRDDEGRPVYRFDAAGAARALDIIGRTTQIAAFQAPAPAVQINVESAGEITLIDRIQRARERLARHNRLIEGEAEPAPEPEPQPLQIVRPGEAAPAEFDEDALAERIAQVRARILATKKGPRL